MKAALFLFAALLAGCDANQRPVIDQCMRAELFNKCMTLLPAGPSSTKYNDWSEVVSECRDYAMNASIRNERFVKPECAR